MLALYVLICTFLIAPFAADAGWGISGVKDTLK